MCNAWCFTPTFLTVIVLSSIFFNLQGNPHLEDAFMGIRASIVALIVYAGFKISKTAIIDKTTFFLMAFMLSVLLIVHLHPILIIISGAILGFVAIKVKEVISTTFSLEMVLLLFIFLLSLAALLYEKIHPALVIVFAGVIGVVLF